jgi:hypothetical protein
MQYEKQQVSKGEYILINDDPNQELELYWVGVLWQDGDQIISWNVSIANNITKPSILISRYLVLKLDIL